MRLIHLLILLELGLLVSLLVLTFCFTLTDLLFQLVLKHLSRLRLFDLSL